MAGDRDRTSTTAVSGPTDLNPGDQAPPGSPQSGERQCPRCSGSGRQGDAQCEFCGGTGMVIELVGDA